MQKRKPSAMSLDRVSPDPATAWMSAMRSGDFGAAWQLSDLALRRREPDPAQWNRPRHLQQIWTGAHLSDRRVLVRCYHGLGDTIQFSRFIAPLRRKAREVIVWVQPDLLPLIRTGVGADRCMPLHDGTPDVEYDRDIEIMELPYALRIDLDTLPRAVPYLHPPQFDETFSTGPEMLRVGLAWRGGNWDPRRSIPLESIVKLAGIRGVALFSLQQDTRPSEFGLLGARDFGRLSIFELAGRVSRLDLVITVDTMTAHQVPAASSRGAFPCREETPHLREP